ncbi:hypothetical protein GGI43DRAFT_388016 [Trichoderma evansii]
MGTFRHEDRVGRSSSPYPRPHLLQMPLEVRFKIFYELWEDQDFDLLMVIKDYEDRHNDENPITLASIAFVHFSKNTHWPHEKIPWDRYAPCLGKTQSLWFNRRIHGGTRSNKNYFNVFNLMISCKQLWEEGSLAYWGQKQKQLQLAITPEFGEIPLGDEEEFSMPQSTNSKLLGGVIGQSVRNLTLRFDDKVLNCRATRCDTVPGIMNCKRHTDATFMPKLQWARDTIMKALRLFTNVTSLVLLIENNRIYDLYNNNGIFGEIMEFIKEERPMIKVIRIKGGQCADLVKQWNVELDASVSGTAWSMNPCVPTCQSKKYSDHTDKFDTMPREVDLRPDFS